MYQSVLEEVQEHISQNYASLLLETDKHAAKEQIKFQIKKYLADKKLSADGMSYSHYFLVRDSGFTTIESFHIFSLTIPNSHAQKVYTEKPAGGKTII